MKKYHATIIISAPREKVWESVIGEETYKEWTKPFGATSRFEGDWNEGAKMRFIGTDEEGKEMGMIAVIAESRKPEFLSIRHIGYIMNGVEDTTSDAVKAWAPAFENYALNTVDGGTEFVVDVDIEEQYYDMMIGMWPKALEALKTIAER